MTLKVLDFGIAKLVSEAGAIGANTSALGTPLWMSPEQTDSKIPIGPKADIWALGLIAYFVLCGHHYWRVAAENGRLAALMREVLASPWGRLFREWETAVADADGYSNVGDSGAEIRRTGLRALVRSIGILGTCLKEAPEFIARRTHRAAHARGKG